MKKTRKVFALLLSLAMLLTAGGFGGIKAEAAAKKLKVSATKVTVNVGKSKKVTVKNKPSKAKVKWTVANKKIATVKSGKITGKKAGSTKVTCKVTYSKKKAKKTTKKFTIKVTVKKSVAATTAPKATATAVPTAKATVAPTTAPTTEPTAVVTPEPTKDRSFTIKSDDTSNIGEEREVTIEGGATVADTTINATMKVKDNGTMRKELSSQYLIANEMGQGINLGNTMEATKAAGEIENFHEATDFETAWGAQLTTQEYISSIHSYGFNTLRVPIAWSSMIDDEYNIDTKMLGRVEQIVNYALNEGMYVVINDHYDYAWWGQFGSPDEKIVAEAWKRYEAFWTQISDRFGDYSDHLIFESANEELGTSVGGDNLGLNTKTEDSNGELQAGTLTVDQAYQVVYEINQKFVNIVRDSATTHANNAYRHLLIAGYNTSIDATVSDDFKMPTDTEENGKNKLSISVHYYTPWDFCGDDASGATYTEEDKANTEVEFAKMDKFKDAGYGIILGEFGVCNPRQDNVTDCLYDVMSIAGQHGMVPVLWDTPGTYFDRTKCIMNYKDVAELYNKITGANGNTTDIKVSTGAPSAVITPVDIPASEKPVWSWTGEWAKNDATNIGLDGNKVTSTDITKFVKTDDCTDDTKITFNDWGYQTYMNLDWSSIASPCLKITFAEGKDTEEAVGELIIGTTDAVNGSCTDQQKFPYTTWAGKGVILPETMTDAFKDKNYLMLTFGNAPKITKIEVYDYAQ